MDTAKDDDVLRALVKACEDRDRDPGDFGPATAMRAKQYDEALKKAKAHLRRTGRSVLL